MSASAPKSTTDTAPELQLTEEERELLSIRTVPEFEAAQAARRRAKALAKAPESHLATVRRARKINRILGETYPYAVAELDFTNAFELLIATVLSAQTTDVRVNQVTPALFARYPDAPALAAATEEEVEPYIQSLGFYRAKTKSCLGLAASLCENYGGDVPETLRDLVTLPGVGRKTANVVLGDAFGIPGITVDTHVGRLARRWAWTRHEDPVGAEADIASLVPEEDWTIACHRIIYHGRQVCRSRKPECPSCPIADLCPSYPLFAGAEYAGGRAAG